MTLLCFGQNLLLTFGQNFDPGDTQYVSFPHKQYSAETLHQWYDKRLGKFGSLQTLEHCRHCLKQWKKVLSKSLGSGEWRLLSAACSQNFECNREDELSLFYLSHEYRRLCEHDEEVLLWDKATCWFQTLKQRPIKSKNYISIAAKSCKGETVGAVFKINLGDDSTPSWESFTKKTKE